MLLGRVIGAVVPCVVTSGLEATRMAGPGEMVYYEGGREAALALDPSFVPVDHAIVGIVDDLHVPAGGGAV